jgi:hypothetical protein
VTPPDPALNGQDLDVAELVDAEVVATPVGDAAPLTSAVYPGDVVRRRPGVVAVQAAAVVTTGFVAGAIATAVVGGKVGAVRRRRHARRLPSVVGTQRFLVDVHLLGDR